MYKVAFFVGAWDTEPSNSEGYPKLGWGALAQNCSYTLVAGRLPICLFVGLSRVHQP